MASDIGICNMALSHLGDAANVSDFNEGSMQADQCRTFYPIARDVCLEMGEWDFATRRIQPALISNPPPSSWLYAYALPADCLKALAVFGVSTDERITQPFIIESASDGTRVLYTNQVNAILRYTLKITDTSQFSPLFEDAVGWLLASYLSGPIIKGDQGIQAGRAAYSTFLGQLGNAKSSNDNQQQQAQHHVASLIAARRGLLPYGYPGYFPYNCGDQ